MKKSLVLILLIILALIGWLIGRDLIKEDIIRDCSKFECFKPDTIDLRGAFMIVNGLDTLELIGDLDSLYEVFGPPYENYTGNNPYSKRSHKFFYMYDFSGIGFVCDEGSYEMNYIGITNPRYKISLVVPSIGTTFSSDIPGKIYENLFPKSYYCQQVINRHQHILRTIKLVNTDGDEVLLKFDANQLVSFIVKD